jgi:fatty acid desaturase
MLIIGSRLQAIGIIGHMAGHGYGGRYRRLLCQLTFLPLGLSPEKYRKFHFAHHRYLGTKADPELAYINQFRHKWERPRLRDSVADLLGLNVHEFVAILRPIADAKSIALLLGFLALLALAIGPLILVLLASYVTTLMFVFRLRYRAEHDHVNRPGHTFWMVEPPLWVRLLYLPHGHWRHADHHNGVKGA